MSSCNSVVGLLARARRPVLVVAAVPAVALALGGSFAPLHSAALILLPALALAIAMLVRPYLGAQAIARMRSRLVRGRRATVLSLAPRREPARVVRGGHLIALALAGRAPPRTLVTCR